MRTPTSPMAMPTTPPMSPCTSDSPATWPTMRRLLQPMAFRVPNSRVRRVTPEMVKRIAIRNAAASTMIDSQVPRFPTRVEAVESDPDTLDAEVGLGADRVVGQRRLERGLQRGDVVGRGGLHVDARDLAVFAAQALGDVEGDVHVRCGRRVGRRTRRGRRSRIGAADVDRSSDREGGRRRVGAVEDGHVRAGVVGCEGPAVRERHGRERTDSGCRGVETQHRERVDAERGAARAIRAAGRGRPCLLARLVGAGPGGRARAAAALTESGSSPSKVVFVSDSTPAASETPSSARDGVEGRRVECRRAHARRQARGGDGGGAVRRRARVGAEVEVLAGSTPSAGAAAAFEMVMSVPTP